MEFKFCSFLLIDLFCLDADLTMMYYSNPFPTYSTLTFNFLFLPLRSKILIILSSLNLSQSIIQFLISLIISGWEFLHTFTNYKITYYFLQLIDCKLLVNFHYLFSILKKILLNFHWLFIIMRTIISNQTKFIPFLKPLTNVFPLISLNCFFNSISKVHILKFISLKLQFLHLTLIASSKFLFSSNLDLSSIHLFPTINVLSVKY